MHGKSTTTAIAASVFEAAGLDPTVFGGARMKKTGECNLLGGRECFVFEACEYMGSFLDFYPTLPVVLNTDNSVLIIVVATILNACYYTFSPAITRKLSRDWTGDTITLGFMDQVGSLIATWAGKVFGSKDPEQDADKLKLPKWASMFRDNTVVLFFLMPINADE